VDIEAPITRHPTDRKRMTVLAGGRHAVTHVRVTARFAQTDLLRVTLGTGRTHQIRVHLAHVGHPVVGDREYAFGGSRRVTPSQRQAAERLEALAPRQLLHAALLALPPAPASGSAPSPAPAPAPASDAMTGGGAGGGGEWVGGEGGDVPGTTVLLELDGGKKVLGFTVDEVVDLLSVGGEALERRQA